MEAGDAVKQRNNAERIKEAVLQVHGSGDGLLRHDNGKDHQREKEAASAEIEAGQAVGHQHTGHGGNQRGDNRREQRIQQHLPQIDHLENNGEILQCKIPRNPDDRRVIILIGRFEGVADHIKNGIQDDEAQPDQQRVAENHIQDVLRLVHADEMLDVLPRIFPVFRGKTLF